MTNMFTRPSGPKHTFSKDRNNSSGGSSGSGSGSKSNMQQFQEEVAKYKTPTGGIKQEYLPQYREAYNRLILQPGKAEAYERVGIAVPVTQKPQGSTESTSDYTARTMKSVQESADRTANLLGRDVSVSFPSGAGIQQPLQPSQSDLQAAYAASNRYVSPDDIARMKNLDLAASDYNLQTGSFSQTPNLLMTPLEQNRLEKARESVMARLDTDINVKKTDTGYMSVVPGFNPFTTTISGTAGELPMTFKGAKEPYPKYIASKTQAVEKGTGRIASQHGLTTDNADLEDHFFIQRTPGGPFIDVGIYDPDRQPRLTGSVSKGWDKFLNKITGSVTKEITPSNEGLMTPLPDTGTSKFWNDFVSRVKGPDMGPPKMVVTKDNNEFKYGFPKFSLSSLTEEQKKQRDNDRAVRFEQKVTAIEDWEAAAKNRMDNVNKFFGLKEGYNVFDTPQQRKEREAKMTFAPQEIIDKELKMTSIPENKNIILEGLKSNTQTIGEIGKAALAFPVKATVGVGESLLIGGAKMGAELEGLTFKGGYGRVKAEEGRTIKEILPGISKEGNVRAGAILSGFNPTTPEGIVNIGALAVGTYVGGKSIANARAVAPQSKMIPPGRYVESITAKGKIYDIVEGSYTSKSGQVVDWRGVVKRPESGIGSGTYEVTLRNAAGEILKVLKGNIEQKSSSINPTKFNEGVPAPDTGSGLSFFNVETIFKPEGLFKSKTTETRTGALKQTGITTDINPLTGELVTKTNDFLNYVKTLKVGRGKEKVTQVQTKYDTEVSAGGARIKSELTKYAEKPGLLLETPKGNNIVSRFLGNLGKKGQISPSRPWDSFTGGSGAIGGGSRLITTPELAVATTPNMGSFGISGLLFTRRGSIPSWFPSFQAPSKPSTTPEQLYTPWTGPVIDESLMSLYSPKSLDITGAGDEGLTGPDTQPTPDVPSVPDVTNIYEGDTSTSSSSTTYINNILGTPDIPPPGGGVVPPFFTGAPLAFGMGFKSGEFKFSPGEFPGAGTEIKKLRNLFFEKIDNPAITRKQFVEKATKTNLFVPNNGETLSGMVKRNKKFKMPFKRKVNKSSPVNKNLKKFSVDRKRF